MSCLYKVVIHIFFFCVISFGSVYGVPDSTGLPASLQKELAEHKRYNDLESWIYARINYTDANPVTRIDFLMRTQRDAWRSYQNYAERLVWFDLLSLQGYYQLQNGNILSSISAYEAALEFYESFPLPDVDVIETVLKPLGNNYTRLADYKTALFIHQKTLALALTKKNRQLVASIYSNMAICARWQGQLQTAVSYCRAGIDYVPADNALHGLLLSTWADVLAEQNQYDTAAIVCRQALGELHRNILWYAGTLQIAARIAWKRQQYQQAVVYGKQSLYAWHQHYPGSKQREKAKVLVLLGDIHNSMHKPEEALDYNQQALLLLDSSENTMADALNGKAVALTALNQPEQALEQYLASFKAEKKLRAAFFYNESRLRELQVTRSRVEAAMNLVYRMGNNNHILLMAEISRAQVLMDERRWRTQVPVTDSIRRLQNAIVYYQEELLHTANKQHIRSLLQATEYELGLLQKKLRIRQDEMLGLPQLQDMIQGLPSHVTVLEFFAGRDSSYIIEYTKKGVQHIQCIPASARLHDTIQGFMQHWFANGPANMINSPRGYNEASNAVYKKIFAGYSWKKDRHYLLMPDGMFNYLPFDALVTDQTYLCKLVSLSQAYSLQTWAEQQNAKYTGAAFNAFFVSKGPALSIEKEYKALQKQIKGGFFINEKATHQLFNAMADSSLILHISTHAISSAMDSFPYLQLFDKPFYLFDLRYKHFAPSLVVLGACKTADGVLQEGEGVNSISRGFTAAGAGGVVSGLWNVNDEAAIEMMQHFYGQLEEANDPAMALHLAKLQWLQTNHNNAILQLPYYWAGFVYSGHLQKVPLSTAYSYQWLYWLAGIGLIAGFATRKIFYRSRV